jgi:cytoskeletal protein RodZ
VAAKSGKSGLNLSLLLGAAVLVVLVGTGGWFLMRGNRGGGNTPAADAAPVSTPVPGPTAPAPPSDNTAAGPTSTPPADTGAQPGAAQTTPSAATSTSPAGDKAAATTPLPGQASAATTAAGRSSTSASGTSTKAPGASGVAARGRAATAPAAPAAPAVVDTPVTYDNLRAMIVTGSKTDEQDATLTFQNGQVSLNLKKDNTAIGVIPYKDVVHATHVHAKNPKWDTSLAAPPADVDLPGGIFRSVRHWLALQSRTAFLLVRTNDTDTRTIIQTLLSRTGIKLDEPDAGSGQ